MTVNCECGKPVPFDGGREGVCECCSTCPEIFDRLSPAQLDALCNVAFGGYGAGCNKRTLAKLEAKGLIERVDEERADGRFTFTIHKWVMPIPVHIDFCAWCSAREEAASV